MDASLAGGWWRPFRLIGEATVVHVDLTPHAAHEAAALEWLDDQERARTQRFAYAGPRRRYELCRAALRAILCLRLGCTNVELALEASEHGKPYAIVGGLPAPISFNVSHSGRHGLIALAPAGRLGVDIEERVPHRNLDLLVETMFSAEEQALLALARGSARMHLFFRLWTIKEALIKAHGMGMALNAARFEVPRAMLEGRTQSTFQFPEIPGVQWRLDDLGNEQFAAALAHELGAKPASPRPGYAGDSSVTRPKDQRR